MKTCHRSHNLHYMPLWTNILYAGQTKRALKKQISDHKTAIHTENMENDIAKHYHEAKHCYPWTWTCNSSSQGEKSTKMTLSERDVLDFSTQHNDTCSAQTKHSKVYISKPNLLVWIIFFFYFLKLFLQNTVFTSSGYRNLQQKKWL